MAAHPVDIDNHCVVAAGIVCLLVGQAVLTYFWSWVVQSYDDRPIPLFQWVPSYPARSMRVLLAGVVLMSLGLSLVNFQLSPWQAGLLAGAVMAMSAVPVYVHNLSLRRRPATALPAPD